MKYAIDRIENEKIVVLENLETREITNISIDNLPVEVKEGSILKYVDNQYFLDDDEKEARLKRIQEKLDKLKNLN